MRYKPANHCPWADYPVTDRRNLAKPSPVLCLTFADGETVRAPFATAKGKALNVGRGLRTAIAYYRARIARRLHPNPCDDGRGFCIDVPAIVACRIVHSADDSLSMPLFPHVVSEATAQLRRGTFNLGRVVQEARDRRLPLMSTGGLTVGELIGRRYQRAAARHLLTHPELMAKYRAIAQRVAIRKIAMYTPDPVLNPPKVPAGRVRNQFMARPKPTWHQADRAV